MMRRILSVWLPHWPITRLNHNVGDSLDRPPVTVETIHGVRLITVGEHGEVQGLRAGQTLTEARAICPALLPVEADPAADATALLRIAAWCEHYTPMVATDPPDGLWLDITCGAGISEAELMRDLASRLNRNGISCRLAVAGTTGAAWALAHACAKKDRNILAPGQEMAALADLPLASPRIEPGTVAGLRRLGLRTVQELLHIPRPDITARFGASPVLRLDQALGFAKEAIDRLRPPITWFERLPSSSRSSRRKLWPMPCPGLPCVCASDWRSKRRVASALPLASSVSTTRCLRFRSPLPCRCEMPPI